MAVLQDTEKAPLSVVLTDAAGEPVSHPVTFETDGATGTLGQPVISIETDDTGQTFVIATDVGSSVITATEQDPDGSGVTATLQVDVVASDAVTLQINLGTPVPK